MPDNLYFKLNQGRQLDITHTLSQASLIIPFLVFQLEMVAF